MMKQVKLLAALVLGTMIFSACQKETGPSEPSINALEELSKAGKKGEGRVYTLSNQAGGNQVISYRRMADGTLSPEGSIATGGNGTGGGLGNQGGIILKDDGGTVLAVNAGSNTISSLKVTGSGLNLKSVVSSGGMQPVSLTQYKDLVFVLNAGGDGNISGFRLGKNDKLSPIPGSTRPLSSTTAGAAQISFVNYGKALAITEKATNKIISYTVNMEGIPGAMHMLGSATPTPFGFAVGAWGNIFVSEAAGGAPGASTVSSYNIAGDGTITLVDGPEGAGQSAACWVVLTKDGNYAYATNTASNNVSSFATNAATGSISVHQAIAAATPAGPIDAALSDDSKFLYVLNAGGQSISVFAVGGDGGLSPLQTVTGLPAGANGLAAK